MSARRGTRGTALAAALAATAALGVATLAGPLAAVAGATAAPASLDLDVTRIHGTVEPGGALRLGVRLTNRSRQDRDGLRLVVTMHQRTRWRSEYHQAVDAGVLGAAVHADTIDVGSVPARGARTFDLEHGADELGLAGMVERELQGVYPLRLQLLEGDEVADEVVTSVVAVPARVEAPLAVAPVVTLAHPPSRDAGGVFVDLGLADQLEPGGALVTVLDTLLRRGDVPLTLVADALTLEETSDLAAGFLVPAGGREPEPRAAVRPASSPESRRARAFLSALQEAVDDPAVEVVPLPYASADLAALVRGGLASEAARHLTEGARALESATGRRPSGSLLVPPDAITADALAHALTTGARAVVLSPSEVEMAQITGLTPSSLRRLRAAPGTSVQALIDDPWLEATLAQPHRSPAVAAQRVLGELATIYFERPNRAGRGVMLRLDGDHGRALVEAIGTAPFLRPETLTSFRLAVLEEPDPVRLAYPREARSRELPPSFVAELRAARRSLGSLDGVLVGDRSTPAQFDRVLLQAASVHHREAPQRGAALLRAVTSTVEDLYTRVDVPETPAVTLTSLEGELPVTVRSDADVPLRVRVHLRTARLAVDGGPTREIVLEPGSRHVLMLPVRALSPGGTAPVDVQVTDVDGEVVLARGQVVVRSTAFSVTAVVVVAGAALFLLVWLGQEAARRRQRPSASPQPAPRRAEPVAAGGPRTPAAEPARPPPGRPADRA